MRKLALTVHIVLLILMLTPTLAYASTEVDPWAAIFDEDENPCEIFNVDDLVHIKAYSNRDYEVIITDPSNEVRYIIEVSGGELFEETFDDITDELGWWKVEAGSTSTFYASGYYEVIPEAPFLLTAFFAALGLIKIHQARKKM